MYQVLRDVLENPSLKDEIFWRIKTIINWGHFSDTST